MLFYPGSRPKLGSAPLSAQQRTLAQWRGLDLTAVERNRAASAKRIRDVMPRVVKDLKLDRRRSEAEVIKAWNNLIDPNLTAHAQPAGLVRGTLFVTVDHSTWLSEIVRYRRREILERLQNCFGRDLITRISFRVG
jgi:predicted nucleic acid-binding Zn ribbon protein